MLRGMIDSREAFSAGEQEYHGNMLLFEPDENDLSEMEEYWEACGGFDYPE
jgi:hypothetical protein